MKHLWIVSALVILSAVVPNTAHAQYGAVVGAVTTPPEFLSFGNRYLRCESKIGRLRLILGDRRIEGEMAKITNVVCTARQKGRCFSVQASFLHDVNPSSETPSNNERPRIPVNSLVTCQVTDKVVYAEGCKSSVSTMTLTCKRVCVRVDDYGTTTCGSLDAAVTELAGASL